MKDGDKVLVPADTWVTNVGPVIQLGFTPIFCDINLKNFSFCEEDLEYLAKKHPDIKVIFITHLIGYPANRDRYSELFPDAILLDDVCESHGCENPNGTKVGFDSLGSTFSFYFGHHMSTVEGGMISTNNYDLYDLMRMKRSHGLARESERFHQYTEKYPEISKQFMFITDGYNFRNTEICAVLGLSQLKRLDKYIEKRNINYSKFISLIKRYSEKFVVPEYHNGVSNFVFHYCKKDKKIAQFLKWKFDDNGIEHRPIIGGNLLRQPFLKNYNIDTQKEKLNVDFVHDNGLYLGNNHFIGNSEIKLLESILEKL